MFIETKVWVSDFGYDETLHALEKATGKLGVDQLDLLILHQPAPDRFEKTIAAYKALETLLADGRVRAIGVSNFMPHHLKHLLDATDVVPAVNQIELHPYFSQPDVQAADAEHGILTQAWSPIGGITFYPGWGEDRKNVMEDPAIAAIAAAHGKTPAQVMLRWHLQQGRSAIPKSTNPARIAENFDVFDFELTADELASIDALDTGVRNGPDPDEAREERFAFHPRSLRQRAGTSMEYRPLGRTGVQVEPPIPVVANRPVCARGHGQPGTPTSTASICASPRA